MKLIKFTIIFFLTVYGLSSCSLFMPKSPIPSDKSRRMHYVAVKMESKREKKRAAKKAEKKKMKEGDVSLNSDDYVLNENGVPVDSTGSPLPLSRKQKKAIKKDWEEKQAVAANDEEEYEEYYEASGDSTGSSMESGDNPISQPKKKKRRRIRHKWDNLNTGTTPSRKKQDLDKDIVVNNESKKGKKSKSKDSGTKSKKKKKEAKYEEGGMLLDEEGNPIDQVDKRKEDDLDVVADAGEFEEEGFGDDEFEDDSESEEDIDYEPTGGKELLTASEKKEIRKEDRKFRKEQRKQERAQRKEEGYVKLYRSRVTPWWRWDQDPKTGKYWKPAKIK
jgi:hypothetical protein